MMKRGPKTWVEVSRSALVSNARAFRRRIGPKTKLMAVVKANAYGHGLVETANAVRAQVDWFGVDTLDEAAALRKAGMRTPALSLGFTPSWRMKEAAKLGAHLTVSTLEQVRAARSAAQAARRKVFLHVKVETGTTRQGARLKELPAIAAAIASSKYLVFEGLSTHYANAEDADGHEYAAGQLETFRHAAELLEAHGARPALKHTACTAAAALFDDTRFDMIRLGIGLYGLWPSEDTRREAARKGIDLDLAPALAWKTVIAQVKEVRRGTPVGYGLTERMAKDGKIAVLPVGYWDGYDRGLSSRGEAIVRGQKARVMGRICMNMCMLDVSHIPGARAEDEVLLLGRGREGEIPAETLAKILDTISYEVVTRINPQLPRIVV